MTAEDCTDPGRRAVQATLSALMYPAFSVAPMTFAAAAARLAARSITDGLTTDSVVGINDFGLLACGALGQVDVGYGFSQQARRLIAERGLTASRARVECIFNAFIRHRKEPIRDTLEGLVEAERIGLATGDVQSASLANFDRSFQIFWIGERLELAETAFAASAAFCEDLSVGTMPDLIRLYRETIAAMQVAREQPERLCGDFADGDALLEAYAARRDANGLVQLHIAQALVAHIFGRRETALEAARRAVEFLNGIPSTPAIPAFYVLFAMIANPAANGAALAPADLAIMEQGAAVTAEWARHAPGNYGHHASAAAAELALARGEEAEWFEKMDLAAEQAGEGGFSRDAALALERIAEVSRARGRQGRYAHYIQYAWRAWVHYDATAKTDQLVREHGEEIRIRMGETAHGDTPVAMSISLSDDTLDLGSLLKATRAISQEVTVAALVRALLAGIVETAGAERALVVAPDGEDFGLVAEIVATPDGPSFSVPPSIDGGRRCDGSDAPLSALRLVARTRTALVCGDAAGDARLSGDPYFGAAPKVSVAALPLLRGADLFGVVYLENRQVSDAFSETRLNILRALCAQAAITWDNAALYDRQSKLLAASDRFVPVELFRLFNRNSITDIALGDSIERRMTILVSDLRGFSAQAERLGPEQTFSVVNEFVGMISSVVRAHDGLVLKYVGDGVLAIFPGGTKDALAASVELHELLRTRRPLEASFSAGIAVHSGDVMLGAVGDVQRLQIDAISDAVNTTFRLEGMTKDFGARVVVSGAAIDDLEDRDSWSFRRLGDVDIQGRDKRESLLELIDAEPKELRQRKIATRDLFDDALRRFERGDDEGACRQFREVLNQNPADAAATRLLRIGAARLANLMEPIA